MHCLFLDAEFTQFRDGEMLFASPLIVCFDYKLDWRFFEATLRAARQWDRLAGALLAEDIAGVATPGSRGEAAQNALFEASTRCRRAITHWWMRGCCGPRGVQA